MYTGVQELDEFEANIRDCERKLRYHHPPIRKPRNPPIPDSENFINASPVLTKNLVRTDDNSNDEGKFLSRPPEVAPSPPVPEPPVATPEVFARLFKKPRASSAPPHQDSAEAKSLAHCSFKPRINLRSAELVARPGARGDLFEREVAALRQRAARRQKEAGAQRPRRTLRDRPAVPPEERLIRCRLRSLQANTHAPPSGAAQACTGAPARAAPAIPLYERSAHERKARATRLQQLRDKRSGFSFFPRVRQQPLSAAPPRARAADTQACFERLCAPPARAHEERQFPFAPNASTGEKRFHGFPLETDIRAFRRSLAAAAPAPPPSFAPDILARSRRVPPHYPRDQPGIISQELERARTRKDRRRETSQLERRCAEMEECTFSPQLRARSCRPSRARPVVVSGLSRFFELRALAQRQRVDRRRREAEVFGDTRKT
eukprot:gnl/Chilomastix_cuspidata/5147.p1 GENE.gnl/Chilomastix_cuspidata/5147~~gnl/Chilomastix_cuspidata/5147.p1  ORF type:complete len:454 (-),score=62.32 gnl/Chilomastix_cuspidata/5147:668-1969(-)